MCWDTWAVSHVCKSWYYKPNKPKTFFKMLNFLAFFEMAMSHIFLNFRVGNIIGFKKQTTTSFKRLEYFKGVFFKQWFVKFFQAIVRWGTCQIWIVNTSDWLILGCQNTYFQSGQNFDQQCNAIFTAFISKIPIQESGPWN